MTMRWWKVSSARSRTTNPSSLISQAPTCSIKGMTFTVSPKSTSREIANRYVRATSARRAFGLRRQFLRAPQAGFPAVLRFLLDFRLTLAEPFNLQFEVFSFSRKTSNSSDF